ncbi:MAG: PilZ domain-containing protein [Parasphingopyxis sp.]|uniref:PilZ domain-containing protein n=1 Tax=Parasphingopyxis sp. TaxID=1920299 RepID=UPI0032EEFFC4
MHTRLSVMLSKATKERRRFRRFRLAAQPEETSRIVIVDISRGGCQIQHDGALKSGERIVLQLPSIGVRAADTMWSVGRNAGCEFHTVLSDGELERLLADQRPRGGFGRAQRDDG